MKKYGLIGYPLSHSFSRRYFTEKFAQESIPDATYELFPLENIEELPTLLKSQPNLVGLNVTIPHKQAVVSFLDQLDPVARRIGAVNTIRIEENEKLGFNSDYYGFRQSLEAWLAEDRIERALVLGTGGASRAVVCALEDLQIEPTYVSRQDGPSAISYATLRAEHHLSDYPLVINTTPLGMSPQVNTAPNLAYEQLSADHYCYDLVYNPEETLFMKKAAEQEAQVKNGLEMLHLQAEKSWKIWNH